jgi:P-type Cu+ transporter
MADLKTLEVPIKGMDCAECTQHVQHAISKLEGVGSVQVFLASEKAIIQADPAKVDLPAVRNAVASAGDYSVPETLLPARVMSGVDFNRRFRMLLAGVFGGVLFIVIAGELLGLFDVLQ